jgi:hypothetical protein
VHDQFTRMLLFFILRTSTVVDVFSRIQYAGDAGCFTEDGTVHDEGRDYRGRNSIRQWKQEVDTKYRYVLQTVSAQTQGDKVNVRVRLTGEFPGSPVELDHTFKLSNDKIASLEIRS